MDIEQFSDQALLLSFPVDVRFAPARFALLLDLVALKGVVDYVPAELTLLVLFDPVLVSVPDLRSQLEQLAIHELPQLPHQTLHTIELVYDGEDLAWLAEQARVAVDELIRLHSQALYTVEMLGFLPGFAYLSGLPPRLHLPRRAVPRQRVPAGAVAIAVDYTAIYPQVSPGGWHLLGSTPLPLFDVARIPPALLQVGDQVRFVPL